MKLLLDLGQYEDRDLLLLEAPYRVSANIADILHGEIIAHGNDLICDVDHKDGNVIEILEQQKSHIVLDKDLDKTIDKGWELEQKAREEEKAFKGTGWFREFAKSREDYAKDYIRQRENLISRNRYIDDIIHDIKTV